MMRLLFAAVTLLCVSLTALAQTAVSPIVQPHSTYVDNSGNPCAGCSLSSFAAGTTTPLATFKDAAGVSQNTNPIILSPQGGAEVWLATSTAYKFVLKSPQGVTIWTVDNVKSNKGVSPCATPNSVQFANSGASDLACDPNITINASTHALSATGTVTGGSLSTAGAMTSGSVSSGAVVGSSLNSVQNPASGKGTYTADPTGATDSTAAIQAALDFAATPTIELPAGIFQIAGGTGANCRPLFLGNHTLRGQGQTATKINVSSNGCSTPITTWTCARTVSGTCTSGVGDQILTLNFATPPFAYLAGVDNFCSPTGVGSACAIAQIFGISAQTPQRYFVFGGGLNGLKVGGPNGGFDFPTIPSGNPITSLQVQIKIDGGTITANNGTGGSFGHAIPGIMAQYDARPQTNNTNWALQDFSINGGCHACDVTNTGWTASPISLAAGSFVGGGRKTQGLIQNVTISDAYDGMFLFNINGVDMKNIHCDTIAHGCIFGQDNANIRVNGLTATNMGFPWQGSTAQQFTQAFESGVDSPGYGNFTVENVYFQPSAAYPAVILPFGIGGFQTVPSPDATHKAMRGVTIRNYTAVDTCIPGGGLVTLFADDLLIDGITNDIRNCTPSSVGPTHTSGFVEIGGSNNHVTNGNNVWVVWSGIDAVYTHASNIEVDHLKWNGFPQTPIFGISGEQSGGLTPCEIDNVNVHDIQATFDNSFTNAGSSSAIAGIGFSEGSATCAIVHVDVHDNIGHNINGVPTDLRASAFHILGTGNGTIPNSDWHFHNNKVDGFINYLRAECEGLNTPTNIGVVVNNLRVDHEVADNNLSNLVFDVTRAGGCTANNFNGVQTFEANSWAGKDFNLSHNAVTGSITGTASACVTTTASDPQFLVGAQGTAVRTNGAALQSGSSTRVNVAANGTATVTVCSGTTAEPAGTYNVSVTNPQ